VPAAPAAPTMPATPATPAVQISHDHLFHTVLGLLDVHTTAREASLDLTHGCTRTPKAAQGPHAG